MPTVALLLDTAALDAADDGERVGSFAGERLLHGSGGSLGAGATATTSYGPPSQRLGLSVSEVELPDALPCIRERYAHHSPFTFRDLLTGLVANPDRFLCHGRLRFDRYRPETLPNHLSFLRAISTARDLHNIPQECLSPATI